MARTTITLSADLHAAADLLRKRRKYRTFTEYAANIEFQVNEANRKAEWLQSDAGRESNAEASKRARTKAKKRKAAA